MSILLQSRLQYEKVENEMNNRLQASVMFPTLS